MTSSKEIIKNSISRKGGGHVRPSGQPPTCGGSIATAGVRRTPCRGNRRFLYLLYTPIVIRQHPIPLDVLGLRPFFDGAIGIAMRRPIGVMKIDGPFLWVLDIIPSRNIGVVIPQREMRVRFSLIGRKGGRVVIFGQIAEVGLVVDIFIEINRPPRFF